MRPTLLKTTVSALVNKGRAVHIEGGPGLGKTQIVKQIADDAGIGFIHIHAPTLQPEDLALPTTNGDRTKLRFVPSERFPLVGDTDTADTGIILIDELPQGDNSIQKTCAHMIQEGDLHGHRIKQGWTFVSTGNRATDRAGANRILSHLRNRVTTLEFEPQLDDWCQWAAGNDVDPHVISFVRFKPGLLNDFDPQRDINPTPRAWVEGVSQVLGAVPYEAEFETFKGAVGEGAAAEFTAFMKIARKLPDPDVVLLNPDKAEVPTDPSTLYAISGAVAHRASQQNFDRVMTYAKRLPPEFMVLVVRDAVNRDRTVAQTKAFQDWTFNEGSKVLM